MALDTTSRVPLTEEEKQQDEYRCNRTGERVLTALEVATEQRRLVLLGDLTTDLDVYWFHLRPTEAWTAFAFDYMGERFTLHYCKKQRFIQLMLYLPAVDAPDEAQELAEMGIDWGDYRCSVWLCDQVEREEKARGPDMVVRYHLSKPFEVFLQMPFRERMQVGVYTTHWEA